MIVTLDFETYFDKEYSLKKMTTEEYIRDPQFKVHGCAIKFDNEPARWCTPHELDSSHTIIEASACLAHHAQFDGLILYHHFGIKPALWLDTLSMARIALPHERHSLDALSKYFGLPGKQFQKLDDVMGVRDPNPAQLQRLGEMSCDDADKTYTIFRQICDYIPREEFRVIDQTIRMFTEPKLVLDEPKLRVYYTQVTEKKDDTLEQLGVTRTDLQSADKFAAILRDIGVEPPTKISPQTGRDIYAFAKTDGGMRELVESDDDRISALASARLGIKSTLNETRCERLLSMSSRGSLAVYLRYAGAHTTRWSGGDSLNWQNFPRGGDIRQSVCAPPGHKLVVVDLSQIEARVLNWLAGQNDVLAKFANGDDIYSENATRFYGEVVTKADKIKRGLGKTIELACGYGQSANGKDGKGGFREMCRRGPMGAPPIILTPEEAERAVFIYRSTHARVKSMWYYADEVLKCLAGASSEGFMWGPCEVVDGAIWLPNGVPLWYDDQRMSEDGNLKVKLRGRYRTVYGSLLCENVVQALSRVILSQAMIRVGQRYWVAQCEHDSLLCVVPLDDTAALPYVLSEMKRTPAWAVGLPLDAEGFEGERMAV